MAIIEELTENDDQDKQAIEEIGFRLGRLPHIKQNFLICATNPDSPAHWAYKYFISSKSLTRHVYYSVTTDNPFLPDYYVDKLLNDLDPKLAERMVYGKWIEIAAEVVYYGYSDINKRLDREYKVDERYPINCSWDFNIGQGKPLSLVMFQFINDVMHIFNEVVVEGMRTLDSCDELAERGLLDYNTKYIINGDAAGRHKDTRNIKSDYDIIKKFFGNYRTKKGNSLDFEYDVPLSNGPIKKRHNAVNAHCENANGRNRLFVYKNAPTADEGLRLTQLKKGGNYIEDDSKKYQHITTAIGYGLLAALRKRDKKPQRTIQL
jgi:hypothetical protein